MRQGLAQIYFLLAMLLPPAVAQAQYDFVTNNGAITITQYTGDVLFVVIPASTNGYPVTAIGPYAFFRSPLYGITIPNSVTTIGDHAFLESGLSPSITLPDSITSIQDGAFVECQGLSSITIPDSVTNIGDAAFFDCENLTSVTLGNGVTQIEESAFQNCESLSSIIIPASVTSIGDFAFYECTVLGSIYFQGNAPPDDGYAFGYTGDDPPMTVYYVAGTTGWGTTFSGEPTAVWYTPLNQFTYMTNADSTVTITGYTGTFGTVLLPAVINGHAVTTLGAGAFMDNTNLTSVTLSNSITSIGSSAFADCPGLTTITIPNSVTNVGDDAFANCTNLTEAYFAGNAPPDDGTAFTGSPTVVNYLVGATGWGASFGGAPTALWNSSPTLFTYQTNADNTITITGYTGALGDVIIPSAINGLTVGSIGNGVFAYSSSLTNITIPNSVTSIGEGAFGLCIRLCNATIPNSVTSIGQYAFQGCYGLTNVIIGNSVVSLSIRAFNGCNSLTTAYFAGNAPSDGGYVFDGSPTIVYYLPRTSGWGTTFDGVPTALWNPTLQTTNGSFGVQNNQFGFNLTGTTNIPVRLEATTNLNQSSWSPLFIGTLTNGSLYFSDPNWTNYPNRFYRVRSP